MIKIILSEEKHINKIDADFMVLKNLEDGIFGPEEFINNYVDDKLKNLNTRYYSAEGRIVCFKNKSKKIKSKNILLIGLGNFDNITLKKIQRLYINALSYIIDNCTTKNVKILTVSHGIGFGFSKKEVFDQLIKSMQLVFPQSVGRNNIESIIINENGEFGRAKIKSYLIDLKLINPNLVLFSNEGVFLNFNSSSLPNNHFKGEIRKAISKDNIQLAFRLLDKNSQFCNKFTKELTLYKNWFKIINNSDLNGTMEFEEKFIRKNRLIVNLLTLIDEY